MLNTYLTQVQSLLQYPPATNSLYTDTSLTTWINTARGQLAGESESIRVAGTLALTAGTRVYPFSAINLAGASGVQGVINVRIAWYSVATGQKILRPRPWEWFSQYQMNEPVPSTGAPQVWAQYGQGVNGTIYVWPLPDASYTLTVDCVCYPINLATDSDPEAIPYLWTDAVQFFGAYFALLSAQSAQRQADADRMFARYREFVARARKFATPSVLPVQYEQQLDPAMVNQLGVRQAPQQGGG